MKLIVTRGLAFSSVSALALIMGCVAPALAQTSRVDQPAPNSPAPAAQQTDATPGAPTPTLSSDQSSSSGDQAAGTSTQDVVVTGTLLRGVAPVGTNVIGVSAKDVVATGAQSANDLLATIPQVANFNSFPTGGGGFGQPIVQTNLRNLGASGGTTTLVLVNGHRVVGSGILQTYVDPQIVPPGIIQRVEVVPDGGSSIYGSDAIGGVINFITRKRMSGVEATARYGITNGYRSVDGNLTVGKDWGSGSLFASYAYAWHNEILGNERGYVTQNNLAQGGTDRRVNTCAQPNVVVAGVSYALPGRAAGTQNLCDTSDLASIYPRENRHTVYVTLDQQLSDKASTNITAYYSRRVTHTAETPLTTNGTITSANPFFRRIGTEASQQVLFDYEPVFGYRGTDNPARFDSWGVTPTFDYDLGGGWHVRALGNYGHSFNSTTEYAINGGAAAAALAGTTTATALNPYDLTQTNPTVLAAIRDYANLSQAKQDLAEGRIVVDGRLLTLPGGDVKVAVGGEVHHEYINASIAFGSSAAPFRNTASAGRDVKSVYGEVFVPVFGEQNATGGIAALDLTGSVRYDHYSDVGGTTNPKIGFNYRPVNWITIRGNYGTSFHAPSLADTTGAVDARISQIAVSPFRAAGSGTADLLRPTLYISGGNPNLKPETAHTWSLGADVKPEFFHALSVSATYYNIDFTNIISVNAGAFTQGTAYYADATNAPYYLINPTLAQSIAFSGGVRSDNFASLQSLYATTTPYVVLDLRRYNRGRLKQDGIDFNVNLDQPTGFGTINAGFAGTYTLHRRTSDSNNGIYVERLDNGVGRLNFVATLGAQAGPITGRAQLTHSGGYPILGDAYQSRVGVFNTVDLYIALDLEKIGFIKATSLTLNVNNILDQDPPYRNAGSGYANGSTLGRLFEFGVRTKF